MSTVISGGSEYTKDESKMNTTQYLFESKEALVHRVVCKEENKYLTFSQFKARESIRRIIAALLFVDLYTEGKTMAYPGASSYDFREIELELLSKLYIPPKDGCDSYQ